MTPPTANRPPGSGGLFAAGVARAAVMAPFTSRARREFLFCLFGLAFGVPIPVAGFFLTIIGSELVTQQPNPPWWAVLAAGAMAGLLLLLLVTTGAARRLGGASRRLAAWLLGERVAAPPPAAGRHGGLARFGAGLRDGPGWRAAAYLLLKLPVAVFGSYAVSFWVIGLINVSFPFWWLSFRNHPPGVRLSPVPVYTPFGWFGQGTFHVATFAGTFAAGAAGVAMLLAAPWVTRAVALADRWLIRSLLGPGKLEQRIVDLEQTRALAVDDSVAMMRRLERNLHDGAQIRLATLAMSLGMAKEKLGDDGAVADLAAVRDLVDAAHRGAKDALVELRDLARGIHPPVLDNGLADALATLAAGSAIPVELTAAVSRRPSPAIESIAYFCAAELLANAVKHSSACKIKVEVAERAGMLELTVTDDGRGGADQGQGSGLSGLAHRASTVDGRVDIVSPMGGPTQITVVLPLRA
ncbi:MAG TPA: sensor domain-containing protein [Streptosporangiaceae bacterium]